MPLFFLCPLLKRKAGVGLRKNVMKLLHCLTIAATALRKKFIFSVRLPPASRLLSADRIGDEGLPSLLSLASRPSRPSRGTRLRANGVKSLLLGSGLSSICRCHMQRPDSTKQRAKAESSRDCSKLCCAMASSSQQLDRQSPALQVAKTAVSRRTAHESTRLHDFRTLLQEHLLHNQPLPLHILHGLGRAPLQNRNSRSSTFWPRPPPPPPQCF